MPLSFKDFKNADSDPNPGKALIWLIIGAICLFPQIPNLRAHIYEPATLLFAFIGIIFIIIGLRKLF